MHMHKPDERPLSLKTGYLYVLYLELKRTSEQLTRACKMMEQMEPWFDPEYRKQRRRQNQF